MSLPTDNLTAGDSSREPNGIAGIGSENAQVEAVDFGIFNEQVGHGVQNLRAGWSTVDGAVTELTRAFNEHKQIVRVVGQRHGKDAVLEQEIHDLKIQKKGIWDLIQQDREKNEARLSDIRRKHDDEVAALQTQADAGAREKKTYEKMQTRLAAQHEKDKSSMEAEFQQRRARMEQESSAKITALEKKNLGLEAVEARLKHELNEVSVERDREKAAREGVERESKSQIQALGKALHEIDVPYQTECRPSHFYADRYKSLFDRIDDLANTYFTDLTDKAIGDSKAISIRLAKSVSSFDRVPIARSECAVVLRLANVQNHIFNVLCDFALNPFFSSHQWQSRGMNSILSEIYFCTAQCGEDVQRRWRVSTLKALKQLDAAADVSGMAGQIVDQHIVAPLYELLDQNQADKFKNDLKGIFVNAIELGRIVESDEMPVYLDRAPSISERDGWREYSTEKYEAEDTDGLSPDSTITRMVREPLCVQPRIFRRSGKATASTSGGDGTTEVIQPGVALFPDTGIFQDGASQWQKIYNAGMEAARSVSGKGKSHSRNTSISHSALGTSPRTPVQSSTAWRKLEFN